MSKQASRLRRVPPSRASVRADISHRELSRRERERFHPAESLASLLWGAE